MVDRQDSRPLLVSLVEYLEEEVRAIRAKRKITQLVTDQEVMGTVVLEFSGQRTIGMGSDQVVDHISMAVVKKTLQLALQAAIAMHLASRVSPVPGWPMRITSRR